MRTSRRTIEKRIDKALAVVERVQEREQDQNVLELIDAALFRSIFLLDEATSDEGFGERLEQLAALEQEEERAYTAGQRQALKRFDRRYQPGRAKEELLLMLAPDRG